jgi:glutaconate CoA-transferase subunit B
VTPLAVFQRRHGRLALESWHPDSSPKEVAQRTGFSFDATGAVPTASITARELATLRQLDPDRAFEAEVRG